MSERKAIAIVGASTDKTKFGNKAVRAYIEVGYDVYPVNPKENLIEGLRVYRSLLDIPVKLDVVSLYVPPVVGMKVLDDIAKKGCGELWLNPGSESDDLIERATELKVNTICACSIVAVGIDPEKM
ncbi:MAG: CoA-binding protein [Verrucomicrobiae bacterium]|nr:CoA-binding protein [Verrucomicrobiae bacterium]